MDTFAINPMADVQVQVEGVPAELDRFQADVADRLSRHIRSAHTDTQPASGEFATFEIRNTDHFGTASPCQCPYCMTCDKTVGKDFD